MLLSKKYSKIFLVAVFLLLATVFLFHVTLAAEVDTGLTYAEGTGLSASQDIRVTIAKIIRIVIGFLGIVAVGLIMYAGWIWMTSEGSEEKIEQAKKILTNAVIGLIIILSAFAIVSFIINSLTGAISGSQPAGSSSGVSSGGLAALGSGVINSHYPERNQTGVPRNTKIIITFKEAMDPATLISGQSINQQNIKIYQTESGAADAVTFPVGATKTEDNKTFVFSPSQYLGSPSEKIWYSVALSKNIKKVNGDLAFGAVIGEIAYDWMFEVGTYVDNTPPKIDSVVPAPASTEARNVVVQINFSEALDPTAAAGATRNGFANIKVMDDAAASLIAGNFYISNQYRTVEFLTDSECGINSCGQTVYCLPANKRIKVLAAAANLLVPGAPLAAYPANGLVDLAGNSLDGNGNGTAEGPQAQSGLVPYNANNQTHGGEGDDYYWLFNTNNTIDITPPVVDQVNPVVGGSGVDLSVIPQATFSKLLMSSSLNSSSINFKSGGAGYNYWITKNDDFSAKKTTANINHDQFAENQEYSVRLNSSIKDIYQNCYTPCSGLGVSGNPSCCNGVASNNNNCQ
ncbi:hypothetical protein GW814_01285 [Candidatus Falkowbacteria bacterium]|nr:hypothetical protein [Candidatus Falkowbacteria bacterium]